MVNKSVLFISYDGMTDPLGQSQVLPYLVGLSKLGYVFTLLSCEKPERYKKYKSIIEEITTANQIDWQPISFTTKPPILAKYYDLYRLKTKAVDLHQAKRFKLVHCRSYVSAVIGLQLKKKFGVKLLFDMRGFWVDERVEGGAWNLQNPVYKIAYNNYKKKEADYIRYADAIISLTEAGKREISTWSSYQNTPIQVIPTSADFNLFALINLERRAASRKMLNIQPEALVISYLGSVGTWYMLDEMLAFYSKIKGQYSKAIFLFITPDPTELILKTAEKYNLTSSDFIIKSAARKEVPVFAAAANINLFFIKQSYSKIASSPTKLGEILAMGIPVICNAYNGDIEETINNIQAGIVLEAFTPEDYKKAVDQIPYLLKKDPETIRNQAIDYYSLENAISKYAQVYSYLLS